MKRFSYAVLIALVLGFSGCAVKNYNYFENNSANNEVKTSKHSDYNAFHNSKENKNINQKSKSDTNATKIITRVSDAEYKKEKMFEWKISKGDRIEIKAFNQSSSNGQLTQLLSNGGQGMTQNRYGDEGILVPANGEINLPLVGKVNLLGMTEEEASSALTKDLKRYLKHPYVHVKILNQKLFVLGEVKKPGTVLVTNGTMSLFEALANRGDLTDYADRTKIKIIRGSMRDPEIREINLTDLNSIRYASLILRPNDIVYVQARDAKASMVGAQEKLPFWQLIGAILAPFNTAIVSYGVVTR
ncbi:polysaccharide biosynthesis/export family protein [Sulfurimonas sp.]